MTDQSPEAIESRIRDELDEVSYPKERLRASIRRTIGSSRSAPTLSGTRRSRLDGALRLLVPMAAALVIFVLGAEYGRRTAPPLHIGVDETQWLAGEAHAIPLVIQSAGSEYVAGLARLSSPQTELTPEQRRLGREVAATVLYAAVMELVSESESAPALRSAARLIAAHRDLVRDASDADDAAENGA